MLLQFTTGYLFFFGVASIAGGVVGYLKAQSKPSLIAGGASGALLIGAGILLATGQTAIGQCLGLLVSLGLAGRFVPQFQQTKKVMPAGIMAALASIGAIASAVPFVVHV